jgi:hypothetical protein
MTPEPSIRTFTSPRPSPESAFSRETILEEAARITSTDRNAAYGSPLENHSSTAVMFAEYLHRKYRVDLPLDYGDVCMFNILQKVSRQANSPKRDNLTDIAGFARNVEMADDELARKYAGEVDPSVDSSLTNGKAGES